MRPRLASFLTAFALVGGTGGALAIAGGSSTAGPSKSAAKAEYCSEHEHEKGCICNPKDRDDCIPQKKKDGDGDYDNSPPGEREKDRDGDYDNSPPGDNDHKVKDRDGDYDNSPPNDNDHGGKPTSSSPKKAGTLNIVIHKKSH